MASTIKIKRSSVAAKVPTTADINTGELALNITDRKLYSSNGTTVFEIGTHKLSVSNAAATYQTKAIERAALANTNLAITNVKTGLTSTNTALRTLISDRLQVANAATLYTTKSNPTTSGLLAHTGRATISTNLAVSGNTTISGLIANGVLGTSNYVLRTNGTSVYWAPASAASPGLVSLTTVAVKDLTQNDNVVTAAQVVAAQSYLQVANAAATYQTKATERAALANTNSYIRSQLANTNLAISNVKTGLTSTNTAIRTLVSDRLQVANAVSLYTTKSNPTTSGLLAHTGRATISTNLAVSGNTTISGLIANGALGSSNYVLRTNGASVYWAPGGGSTTQYITVVNANALFATKAYAAANSYVKSVLANTNLRVNLINTNLTSTNTALRTLISDRLQVANASATYQTKTVERAALANTNLRINLINTNLTGTNTALRTLISDRLQVANAVATYQTKTVERAALANTNASIATQTGRINLINTNLTGTNTALRTLISDRLQVANAATIYQTKTIERAALANTNSRINLLNTNLTGTNTAIRALDAQKLSVANAVATYVTKVNPTTSGLLAHTGRATISTNLAVTGNTTVGGSLTVTGDLTINGTTTTLNSTTLSVDDINITLGDTASPSNATADGGGITLKGTTDKTFNWVSATAAWTSSENINLASGKSLYLNGTDFRATYAANSYVKSVLANTNSFIKSQLANTNLRVNLINTNLTGTNTALRTLISDRLQVANAVAAYQTKAVERAALANTNASIATQASRINLINTNLTSTNTALRTLISDRLQVANAAATYQTKSVERAALANTNLRINLINTNLTGTNTALRTLVSDRYQVANVNTLLNAKATWTALTGTNTAIRALDAQKLQVANATTLFATKASWAGLTGTNTALRLLISDRMQVANAVAIGATKASWAGLTGTNTALRTLISDRLQVANAAATYLTKSNPVVTGTLTANGSTGTAGYYLRTSGTGVYWSPASSGSGGSSSLVSITTATVKNLTQNDTVVTNVGVVAANGYLQVANAVALYTTKSNPTTSGLLAHTGRVTISTNLTVSGNTTLGAASKTITTTGLLAHTGRATISTNLAVTGNTVISAATTSGNNATGALLVTGGIGVGDSLYVKSRIGIANTSSVSVVYMTYNNTTKSLDTTFG